MLTAIAAAYPAYAQTGNGHDAHAAAPAPIDNMAPAADAGADALQTVTVNARRRDDDPQQVPVPMTVLDGETLENQRVYQLQDLQQLLPSTSISLAQPRQASISVRGIGANAGNSDGFRS